MVIKTLYEKCEKLQAEINRINKPLEWRIKVGFYHRNEK
jgi:hypothetical protein